MFALLLVDNAKFNLHVHAWFDMSRVVFGRLCYLLVLLTLLSRAKGGDRHRGGGGGEARDGITTKGAQSKVKRGDRWGGADGLNGGGGAWLASPPPPHSYATDVGCSSRAIRNLRIRFRTTGSTNDLPLRGHPRGEDRYIS